MNGECKWGVATKKDSAKEVPCSPVSARHLGVWELGGGKQAAAVAEAVALE